MLATCTGVNGGTRLGSERVLLLHTNPCYKTQSFIRDLRKENSSVNVVLINKGNVLKPAGSTEDPPA